FTFFTPATQETPTDVKSVRDPEPLSYGKSQPYLEQDVAQSFRKTAPEIPTKNVATAGVQDLLSTESSGLGKSTSVPYVDESPDQPGWGVTNNCRLDTPNACQDMHGKWLWGSKQRLRFEQEVRLLKKATTKIARRDQRIQAREGEIKRLDQEIKSLRTVEAESDDKNEGRSCSDTVTRKGTGQASASQNRPPTEQRCAEMDARPDKLSVDFDEELYPHMLTAIAGRCWAIGHGLRLVVMKCVRKGLEYGIEHGKAGRDLAAVEAYDPEAHSKYVKALQVLKDLKYPLVDQLEKLKDAPMELIMTSLHLESNSRKDAP
ncbi:hypothetical protein Tco_1250917, partial [Tanacetum coccineum]